MVYVFLIGRIFFCLVFLIKSIEHFFPKMIDHAASMGVPFAVFLVPFSGVIALLGSLSILLGYKARIGAWFLVAFLLPVTFMMHKFWQSGEFIEAMLHQFCFWKNLALLGTALMIAYGGSGPLSLGKTCCGKCNGHDHNKE